MHVVPRSAGDDTLYCCDADGKALSQFSEERALGIEGAYLSNMSLSELGHSRTLSASPSLGVQTRPAAFPAGQALWAQAGPVTLTFGRPPFPVSVCHVLGSCAGKQMGRINAQPVIASVTDHEPFRDGAISKFVCYAVGMPVLTVIDEFAIAAKEHGCCPKPAVARLVHLGPEAFPHGRLPVGIVAGFGTVLRFLGGPF